MTDRLIELIRKSGCVDTWNYHTDDFKEPNPINELADYLLANGVVVSPCKVGDTIQARRWLKHIVLTIVKIINRLKRSVRKLTETEYKEGIRYLTEKLENAQDLINRLQAENERLSREYFTYKIRWAKATAKLDTAKAEAYKEFAERCKKKASMYGFGDKSGVWVNTKDIDNLLKEMVGDTK